MMALIAMGVAITVVLFKTETLQSKLVWGGILAAGFLLIPPPLKIVAPVGVIICLVIKEKLNEIG